MKAGSYYRCTEDLLKKLEMMSGWRLWGKCGEMSKFNFETICSRNFRCMDILAKWPIYYTPESINFNPRISNHWVWCHDSVGGWRNMICSCQKWGSFWKVLFNFVSSRINFHIIPDSLITLCGSVVHIKKFHWTKRKSPFIAIPIAKSVIMQVWKSEQTPSFPNRYATMHKEKKHWLFWKQKQFIRLRNFLRHGNIFKMKEAHKVTVLIGIYLYVYL